MASVSIPLLSGKPALGDVRQLASQVRSGNPGAAADAHTETQRQIDELQRRLASLTLTQNNIAPLIPTGVTKRGSPVMY